MSGARRAALVLLAAAAACGGGGSGSPGGPDLPNGVVTIEERMAALAALHAELASLDARGLTGAARDAALAAWLAARPEIHSSGVDADLSTVWAVWQDGRALVVADDYDPIPAAAAAAGAPPAVATPTPPSTAAATELPKQVRAHLVHSFGAGFPQVQAPIDQMAGSLRAAGYELVPGAEGDAGLEVLRALSGSGFLYLNTHGAKLAARGGTEHYSVQSSTIVTSSGDADDVTEADLDADRLVYFTARNGELEDDGKTPKYDTRYGITARFIQQYASFGQDSLVFMNVCGSAFPSPTVDAFVAAMHQKGASVYFGWTRTISANFGLTAAQFVVDRLLGANAFRPESPPQRPFEWPSVLADLKRKGLAVDPAKGAELVAKTAPVSAPGAGLLAPSIATLFVNELAGELYVGGTFGEDPGADGTVTIAGPQGTVSLAVVSWAPTSITVGLPASGPGSTGEVVVTVRGVASNPRRLVAWDGLLTYTLQEAGSLKQTLELDLSARLDPEHIRKQAGDAPEPNPLAIITYPAQVGARWSASGTDQTSDGVCTTTVTWSGSGSVAAGAPASPPFYFYTAQVDRTAGTMTMTPSFLATEAGTQQIVVACPGGTETYTDTLSLQLPTEIFDPGTVSFVLPLDATLGVVASQRQAATPSRIGNGTATAKIAWDAIPAVPAVSGTLPL